jgi:mannose/cellobiose epimerase-like protein (N-acyl-D-glucosamine 2-epimerase family)
MVISIIVRKPSKRGETLPTNFPFLKAVLTPSLLWLKEVALPYWGTVGVDHRRGGFHERLTLKGGPVLDVPKRPMVQFRRQAHQEVDNFCAALYRRADRFGWNNFLG